MIADLSKDRLVDQYNDAYWEQRYTLCNDRIPAFLDTVRHCTQLACAATELSPGRRHGPAHRQVPQRHPPVWFDMHCTAHAS